MTSRNNDVAGGTASLHVGMAPLSRGPMAHQLDLVCGNEPMPQIMIRLIGCHVESKPQVTDERHSQVSAQRRLRR